MVKGKLSGLVFRCLCDPCGIGMGGGGVVQGCRCARPLANGWDAFSIRYGGGDLLPGKALSSE